MTQDRSTRTETQDQSAVATGATSSRAETVMMALHQQGASGATGDDTRGEVSAGTIARMMGLATVAEIRLMEGKVDLLATKINLLQVKVEKALTLLGNVSSGADLERIDVQIGALRQMLREIVSKEPEKQAAEAAVSSEVAKKPGAKIQSNS